MEEAFIEKTLEFYSREDRENLKRYKAAVKALEAS